MAMAVMMMMMMRQLPVLAAALAALLLSKTAGLAARDCSSRRRDSIGGTFSPSLSSRFH